MSDSGWDIWELSKFDELRQEGGEPVANIREMIEEFAEFESIPLHRYAFRAMLCAARLEHFSAEELGRALLDFIKQIREASCERCKYFDNCDNRRQGPCYAFEGKKE